MEDKIYLRISKRPEDPKEREKWAKEMAEIQLLQYLKQKCPVCEYIFETVNKMVERKIRSGGINKNGLMRIVCDKCWPTFEKRYLEGKYGKPEKFGKTAK